MITKLLTHKWTSGIIITVISGLILFYIFGVGKNSGIQNQQTHSGTGDNISGNKLISSGANVTNKNSPLIINSHNININYLESISDENYKLNKTEREFFETLKNIFECNLDNGIICNINHLNVFNPFGGLLEKVIVDFEINNNEYSVFLKRLDGDQQTVGYCAANFSICNIAPHYSSENVDNPCYYMKWEEGIGTTIRKLEC